MNQVIFFSGLKKYLNPNEFWQTSESKNNHINNSKNNKNKHYLCNKVTKVIGILEETIRIIKTKNIKQTAGAQNKKIKVRDI